MRAPFIAYSPASAYGPVLLSEPRGANTPVCRVETHLDAFRSCSKSAAETGSGGCAIGLPACSQFWWTPEKRRDESRRGRQECLRHVATSYLYDDPQNTVPRRPILLPAHRRRFLITHHHLLLSIPVNRAPAKP